MVDVKNRLNLRLIYHGARASKALFSVLLLGFCYPFFTVFLMGPANQCKRMFQETRIFAAVFMFVCMALTICSAVWVTQNSYYNLPFSVAQQTVVSYLLHHAVYLTYVVFAFIHSVCKVSVFRNSFP
ncbi:uncharacterized protein DEA37_0000226 [Paragonimus westermani]|uniref:Vesicle transport protein n=1 Tax=Paragonimus westermani TaxID=34504 RepID=A0A5J4NSA9_9TREM|nr:uncharacterized protein DEA37_0000226 [Paragonimus westermani]